MDADQAEMKKRLLKLGVSRLAGALCTLASRNDDVADYVARLVSTPEEGNARIRSQLDELADSGYFIGYGEAYSFAKQLEGFVEDVRMNAATPEEGIELLSGFYEADQAILERCDDSNGAVGEVFRWNACDAFAQFAKKCKDKDSLLKRVYRLYMESEYGVRSALIERASEFLPKKKLRQLVQEFWTYVENSDEEGHGRRHALIGIELLAHQLSDPALFERARLEAWPEPNVACCLDIAKAYAECKEDDKALEWLERIPDEGHWRASEQDNLLFPVLRRKGDNDRAEEVAWRIFRRHRARESLEQLIEVAGKKKRKQILTDQIAEILTEERFSATDATFLVEMNLNSEAATYTTQNAAKLDGGDYWSLTPLAEHMEEGKFLLAATALYRALLDSILARAQSKAYHHGAKYLRKLDAMAGKVTSWEPLAAHAEYKTAIIRDHKRKWRFWEEYGERPE